MNKLIKFLLLAFVPAVAFGGATSSPPAWVYPGATGMQMPLMVFVKNVTILTSGAPADIASIPLPLGVSRYLVSYSTTTQGGGFRSLCETAAGTLAGGTFSVFDGPSGTGNTLASGITLPAAAGLITGLGPSISPLTLLTSQTLYIRQTANSANAGTCSFYINIFPVN